MLSNQAGIDAFLRSADAEYVRNVGRCFRIATSDETFCRMGTKDLFPFFSPALRQQRYRFFHDQGPEPVGFLLWGFLEPDIGKEVCTSEKVLNLHASEWNAGTTLCLLAFAAGRTHRLGLIRKLMRTSLWSVPYVYVRRPGSSWRRRQGENAARLVRRNAGSGRFWTCHPRQNESGLEHAGNERLVIFAPSELQNANIPGLAPASGTSAAGERTGSHVDCDFWIGVAVFTVLHCPDLSKRPLRQLFGDMEERIRAGTARFYFSSSGRPEAVLTWTVAAVDRPNTTLEFLAAPKGLEDRLLKAIRDDLRTLPQPVAYSRVRRGKPFAYERTLTSAHTGTSPQNNP